MKREGRQHGMVRTYRILPSPWNPKPESRFINTFNSPPTAGFFTKVQSRPTNHSKFTGKCGKPRCNDCHMNPCCKSKDKTKGNHKLKSHDFASNCRLMTWRVVDGRPGLNFSGFSASEILNRLAIDDNDDYADDGDDEIDGYYGNYLEDSNEIQENACVDNNNKDDDNGLVGEGDYDDNMSFCDVGFVLDQVEGEDEGWCLVEEKCD
ncbi:hypothetical protein JCGZ_10195 [Jatropha curcas]|uniref:Uncharacterized protein n=1 Tax=Jatropha curcas TaxID=180498 RepID=A0A067LND4_JATCU|nr:uncharacterized protein LOC105633366 [Jatropha curcas]KDP46355.1 hypothetical protein JCGZ_10195 [Jatropha curcas]